MPRIACEQRQSLVQEQRDRFRQGLGSQMMRVFQDWLEGRPAELHAQAHLERWYSSLGWKRSGENFMEAEIPHTPMTFNIE